MPDSLAIMFLFLWIATLIAFAVYLSGSARRHKKTLEKHLKERDLTYLALQKSEERYTKLISNMNEGLIFTDDKDIIRFVNKCACNILKSKAEKILNRSIFDYVLSISDAKKLGLPFELKRPGCSHFEMMQLVRDNGDMFWASLNISYMDNLHDHMPGAIIVMNDMTEQKMAEEKMHNLTASLNLRVKQLDCLFEISDMANTPDMHLEEIFKKAVDIIPQGLKYPNDVWVELIIDEEKYASKKGHNGDMIFQLPIRSKQKKFGFIRIGNRNPNAHASGDILHINEKVLLKNIAERLAIIIEQKMIEKAIGKE
jgi:PAS domain S-box-containing protein